MKLINADQLSEIIEKINPVDYGSMFSYEAHGAAREVLRDIQGLLETAPSIDNAPAGFGKWEPVMKNGNAYGGYKCSVCGRKVPIRGSYAYSFCPYCGAKNER